MILNSAAQFYKCFLCFVQDCVTSNMNMLTPKTCRNITLLMFVLLHMLKDGSAKSTENEDRCIWFEQCGTDPTPGRNGRILNCHYEGKPGKSNMKFNVEC